MPKKTLRKITASEDVAAIIDEGKRVNTELTNLTYQDKGFKSKIADAAEFEEGETSIKMEGNVAVATVTASEKMDIDVNAESFREIEEAVSDGFLDGIVSVKKTLVVPGQSLEAAIHALKEAGIKASFQTKYSLDTKAYREFRDDGSPDKANAKKALDKCVEKKTTFRIKYD